MENQTMTDLFDAPQTAKPTDKLIERLRKLFALGNSPNQHEAEAALAKASQIMQEHQLSMSDVDMSEQGAIVEETETAPKDKAVAILAAAIGKLYDVRVLRSPRRAVFMFIGTSADVTACRMTFAHIRASWKSIAACDYRATGYAGNARSFNNSHLLGFASAIWKRAEALAADRNKTVKSSTGRDLVVVKSAAIDDFLAGRKIKNSGSVSRVSNGSGYLAGHMAGQSIPLHGGIAKGGNLMIAAA